MGDQRVRLSDAQIDTLTQDFVSLVERPHKVTEHMPAGWSVLGVTDLDNMSVHLLVRRAQTEVLHLWVKPSADGLHIAEIESFVEGVGQSAFDKLLTHVHTAVIAEKDARLRSGEVVRASFSDMFDDLDHESSH